MTALGIGIIFLIVLFLIISLGMAIGPAMALVGFLGIASLIGWKGALSYMGSVPYSTVASYTLTVLPLFILMGEFASCSKMTMSVYTGMHRLLGRLRAGLAMSTVAGCAAFGAVCGSGVAAASTFCTVAYPEMKRFNYDPRLSLGTIAAGGTLAVLIPPSNPFIIYAIFADVSVGKLFMSGFFPGILLAGLMMLTVWIWVTINPSLAGSSERKFSWREKLISVRDMWPMILLGVVILGGIWGGIFSPSEAGGAGAFLALVISLGTREIDLKKIIVALRRTLSTTAMIFTIIIGAMIFNYFLTLCKIPDAVADLMVSLHFTPLGTVIAVMVIYFVLGALMDELAMTVLTLPIFLPILRTMGIDLVWFGCLFVIMCQAGMICPPVGINVFVISGMVREVPMGTVYRGILPFLIPIIVCIAILIAFPQIVLYLPSFMVK